MLKLILTTLLIFTFTATDCQIDVKKMLKKKSEEKAEDEVDKTIDKGFDKIDAMFKKDEKDKDKEQKPNEQSIENQTKETSNSENFSENKDATPTLNWSRYDFVPGEEIIFIDEQTNEENGEFPSRWDFVEGRVENAEFDNSNVIYFMTASSVIIPYIKNRDQDYLPEEFTLEFDAYFETGEYAGYYIWVKDIKNQKHLKSSYYPLVRIYTNQAKTNKSSGYYPGKSNSHNEKSIWRHISVSFNRRALKVYLDDARVLNVPNMEINPTGISIGIDGYGTAGVKGINRYIKNVRLAKGAVRLYDKLLQDGKIVANGIRFDVNKATLKPESMGIINEIHEMMEKNEEIKLSIEGHTDAEGETDYNQQLSEKRAKTVLETLVKMGISEERLVCKGFGESSPIAENTSAEGKANNRRVEFIKL